MKQNRVMYEYIVSDGARKACLKKRWLSLIKKVREITILCGVRVCVVIYIPNQPEPVFWPTKPEVLCIMQHFIRVPEIEKSRKKMNQESYLKDKIKKLEEQVKQLWERNREMEAQHYMRQISMGGKTLNEFSIAQLKFLDEFACEKLVMMQRRRSRKGVAAAPPSRQVEDNSGVAILDPWSIVKPRRGEGNFMAIQAADQRYRSGVGVDFGASFYEGGSSSGGGGVDATGAMQRQREG